MLILILYLKTLHKRHTYLTKDIQTPDIASPVFFLNVFPVTMELFSDCNQKMCIKNQDLKTMYIFILFQFIDYCISVWYLKIWRVCTTPCPRLCHSGSQVQGHWVVNTIVTGKGFINRPCSSLHPDMEMNRWTDLIQYGAHYLEGHHSNNTSVF